MNDDRMITIREAVKLTHKSESTIYRLLKEHPVTTETRREGKTVRKYISYRELMLILSQSQTGSVITQSVSEVPNENPKTLPNESVNHRYVNHLEDLIRQLREEIRDQKNTIERLQGENKALNEEIKALLRQNQQQKRPRGIMGYLVERIIK